MSVRAEAMPEGFVVRLHDEVELGAFLTTGTQVVRLTASARHMLSDREVQVTSPASARMADQLLDLDLGQPVIVEPFGRLGDVTLVVPVRDNHQGVDRLLQSCGQHLTCVVVDDASRDGSSLAEIVDRHGAQLIRLDHNVGPAAARNVGLRAVRSSFVAFVDSDVHLAPQHLGRLLAHFVDPALAAVAPRVMSIGGRGWLARYERTSGSLDLGARSASTRPWSRVSYVPSACIVARVDDVNAGFDPTLRSGEDVDLVWRLNESGLRVRHAAEVSVHHDVRPTVAAWLGRKMFYGLSAAPLAHRHGDRVAPAVMSPSTAVAVTGILLQRRWSHAAAVVGATVTIAQSWSAVPGLPAEERRHLVQATVAGVGWQTAGLVLRHWSPLAVVLCGVSRRARRVVLVLGVLDGVLAHRAARPGVGLVGFTVARRAEHLAYGLGVWRGAARERSARCLLPRWLPRRPRGGR